LFSNLIRQAEQSLLALDQHGPGALIAAIFTGQLAELVALPGGHRVDSIFTLFAAGNNPGNMGLAAGATAGWLSAFATQEVEGALNHGLRTLEAAQDDAQSGIGMPELFAQDCEIVE
jgi:hypothetical protein